MKSLERLILSQLQPLVNPSLDPLLFAYQPKVGVEDAIIFLLQRAYAHLDSPGCTSLLGSKPTVMQVNAPLVMWTI